MKPNLKLKFRIIEHYGTQAHFAVCCGRKENWISRIVQGRQLPKPAEKQKIRMKLKISEEEIDSYFSGE
ncbi:MAG: DUF739 family protein [Deltaproteobacteria bacterium]|nr:DUF739 family protein [Deltaproteobacteria bacterium]